MNDYTARINEMIRHFDHKKNKKYKTDMFLRLYSKVGETDEEITTMIHETFSALNELSNNEFFNPKSYSKSLAKLKKTVRSKLGFTHKGELQDEATALGIALGVAFGAAFVSMNSGMIAIGLPLGLAIGYSIGKKKEQAAEKADKIY